MEFLQNIKMEKNLYAPTGGGGGGGGVLLEMVGPDTIDD